MAITTSDKNDAANQYLAYVKGWTAGAAMRAMDSAVAGHPLVETAYEQGYEDGRHSRQYALQGAAQRYGHTPSILRLADESSLAKPE